MYEGGKFQPNAVGAAIACAMSAAGGWLANHFVALFEAAGGFEGTGMDTASWYLLDPEYLHMLSTTPAGIAAALGAVGLSWALFAFFSYKPNYRRGEEHGSAEWADVREMRAYGDWAEPVDNIILARDVRLRYKGADHDHSLNRNVLIVGSPGTGKTRGYVKPNLMQIPSPENAGKGSRKAGAAREKAAESQARWARSFFVTDPKGTTRAECGHLLAGNGYRLREFNTLDWASSCHYNPLAYVHGDEEVITFANCLIKNTKEPNSEHTGDKFWEDSERLLYNAVINYMLTELPPEQRNLPTMCDLIDLGQVDDKNPGMSGLDILFYELEHGMEWRPEAAGGGRGALPAGSDVWSAAPAAPSSGWVESDRPAQPNHPGVLEYRAFESGAEETKQSILISCKVRLEPLRPPHVREVLSFDEMGIDRMGTEKTAVFAVMSDQDSTFNFLHAMLIWQTLKVLCDQTLHIEGGSLKVGVDMLLDEFANYYVPDFEHTVSTVRSRNIGLHIILQSLAQLKARYGDSANIIKDCCDTLLFLGGRALETNEEIAKMIGQQTVTTDNQSNTWSQQGSSTMQVAQHGRDLLDAAEIGKIGNDECLVLIRGANPWRGKKYDVERHPMYAWIDPGHAGAHYQRPFDIAAYRTNPHYFMPDAEDPGRTGDTELAIGWEGELTYLSYDEDGAPREKYVARFRIAVDNVGAHRAYDLAGRAHLTAVCESNEQARAEGREVPFPGVEPFGRAGGLCWQVSSARSNRRAAASGMRTGQAPDAMSYDVRSGVFEMQGTVLQPADDDPLASHAVYTVEAEIDAAAAYDAAMRDAGGGHRGPCHTSLTLTCRLTCANADAAEFDARIPIDLLSDGRLAEGDGFEGAVRVRGGRAARAEGASA